MIDTKELRRLAQAASPGPWWVNQDGLNHGFERGVAEINSKEWHALAGAWTINGAKHSEEGAANAEFIAAANPATVIELLDRLEAAESARRDDYQNWMTALDRNAELLAKLEAAEKERDFAKAEIARLHDDTHELTDERGTYKAACNEWVSMGLPRTHEIHECFMRSTGDRDKHPAPLCALAKWALTDDVRPTPSEEARLVSYHPDGDTCTLNINGVEMYYDRVDRDTQPAPSVPDDILYRLGAAHDACLDGDHRECRDAITQLMCEIGPDGAVPEVKP